jgi:hypothetical protein
VPASVATQVRATTLTVTGSPLGEPNPLPRFAPLRALPTASPEDDVPAAMRDRMEYGRLTSPLPYAVYDGYDRTDRQVNLPAIELDNGVLRAVVLPSLGGRVWSLFDQRRGRELLFVNPRLRFANFGLTDAWFAGGIEWNLGSTGHTTLSNRPMHAGVVRRADGDVLRLWEWERTRDLVLQVDLWLPAGSDRLLASTRVVNPDPEPKPLYYWTNIAVPETDDTRVLTTADHAWRTHYDGSLRKVTLPHPDDQRVDVSYPGRAAHPADYFFDVAGQSGAHLVAVEPDGRGFAQTSTGGLTGRKMFQWGRGAGGRRWQDWLSGGRYAEVQAGRCPTQLEHDRLEGHSTVAWTESFGAVDLDPDACAADHPRSAAHAWCAVLEGSPPDLLRRQHDTWLAKVADAPVDEPLSTGSGWGAVELLLRGASARMPAGLPFPDVDDDSRVPRALIESDAETLQRGADGLTLPPVSDRWRDLLDDAGDHWWVDYARAVNAHLRGDAAAATHAYRRCLDSREHPAALRGLALLDADAGRYDAAADLHARATRAAHGARPFVTEELQLLLRAGRPDDCLRLIAAQPPNVRRHGRTRLLEVQALLAAGSRAEAAAILDNLVVEDLAEGERVLGDLWQALRPGTPIPPHLDFRMTDD